MKEQIENSRKEIWTMETRTTLEPCNRTIMLIGFVILGALLALTNIATTFAIVSAVGPRNIEIHNTQLVFVVRPCCEAFGRRRLKMPVRAILCDLTLKGHDPVRLDNSVRIDSFRAIPAGQQDVSYLSLFDVSTTGPKASDLALGRATSLRTFSLVCPESRIPW